MTKDVEDLKTPLKTIKTLLKETKGLNTCRDNPVAIDQKTQPQ